MGKKYKLSENGKILNKYLKCVMEKKHTKKPTKKENPLKVNMNFEALLTKAATSVVKKKIK